MEYDKNYSQIIAQGATVNELKGDKQTKEHDGRTYHWCIHHMAWMILTPKDCCLAKEQKGENKVAKSATVAAVATTVINPSYQALLLTIAKIQDKEE